jgi:hypothetical protein
MGIKSASASAFGLESWADQAYATREVVFDLHNSRPWVQNNPDGYQVRFSLSVWAGIVGDIVLRFCLFNDNVVFWTLLYLCASSCEEEFMV